MLNDLSQLIYRLTGWKTGLFFLALTIFFYAFPLPAMSARIMELSGGTPSLDVTFFYTPAKAQSMLAAYGDEGRDYYRLGELTIDGIFPLVYGGLLAIALSAVLRCALPAGSNLLRLNLLAPLAVLLDYAENISIILLLSLYPSLPPGLTWAAAAFSALKWLGVFASAGVLLAASAACLVRHLRSS
jgi:hypothetical protein